MQNTLSSPWQGISRALVFGLRDSITDSTNRLFRETGVGHLMAISGMHIGLVFWLTHRGWGIAARLCRLLPIQSGWRELGGGYSVGVIVISQGCNLQQCVPCLR